MKVNINIQIDEFEKLDSNESDKLSGGFSNSFSHGGGTAPIGAANNCLGGNCAPPCSMHQNIGCNAYAGCGG